MRALSFVADIRPLFRPYDIDSMKGYKGIDLSSYEDVKRHAQPIYGRLYAKTCRAMGRGAMTLCKKFKDWMESGMKP